MAASNPTYRSIYGPVNGEVRDLAPGQAALSVDLRSLFGHPAPDASGPAPGFTKAFVLGGELVGEIRVIGPSGREVRLVAEITGRPGVAEMRLPDELTPERAQLWRAYLGQP